MGKQAISNLARKDEEAAPLLFRVIKQWSGKCNYLSTVDV
jgi:hypothetical protein